LLSLLVKPLHILYNINPYLNFTEIIPSLIHLSLIQRLPLHSK